MPESATLENLPATNPNTSATVSASAGTGKTWLLVTRLIRLLLDGVRPDGILAVTFTRKAAAEMQTRLNERLLDLAQCSDDQLRHRLTEMDITVDDTTIQLARTLYETLLIQPHSIRTTTFHSFCQDILRRFPLEADIAPGFELIESSTDERKIAWDTLCADASNDPDGDIANAMETLLDACGGLANTLTALNSFLDHRSDWWAFTKSQSEQSSSENNAPLQFAINTLTDQLNISLNDNPEQKFFESSNQEILNEFIQLLQKHPGKKNDQAQEAITYCLDTSNNMHDRFASLKKAFLTKKGEPLKRKETTTQKKSMGEVGQLRFLEIHNIICTDIAKTQNKINAQESLRRNIAWYRAGIQILNHFQQLKSEKRALDFADLEWRAFLLLNQGDNVHWIQYKLDQRIDHLLIDEFQDTNPTQWRLILPLLQELAAGGDERDRSIFLVGDEKQSIYRFRRADPELFNTAQDWLKENLQAISQPLDISWRSAEAITSFVNQLFGDGPLHQRLAHFSIHSTHYPDLWGFVELLPLVELEEEEDDLNDSSDDDSITDTYSELRNPLHNPRIVEQDQRHFREGQLIAERIQNLIDDKTLIGETDSARPIRYNDIIILLRNRTHAADYEKALREKNIAYTGADRGTLLDSLEARDLVNLLELLIAPFNNLALASLLRSPLFDCSHEDLMNIARVREGTWMQRLSSLSSNAKLSGKSKTNLTRAFHLLSKWQNLAGIMPVHDLLDRIYCEGDVINRYQSGYPPHLQHRATANLTRFIELALEIDSGRYPTIGRFVARLKTLRQMEQDSPDEGTPIHTDSRVRVMTIHASKGLEAPVIFLADATNTNLGKKANQAIVEWPAHMERPESFILAGKKDSNDNFTASILEHHSQAESREDANLLYVAVTRAKQLLFISGCQPAKGNKLGWYGYIMDRYYETNTTNSVIIESGSCPEKNTETTTSESELINIDPRLSKPLPEQIPNIVIAPSNSSTQNKERLSAGIKEITDLSRDDARTRGIFIHRCLQLLSEYQDDESDNLSIQKQVCGELGLQVQESELNEWLDETRTVINHPDFIYLFSDDHYISAYNEVPVQHLQNDSENEQMVYGIIDRLVVTENDVLVIDYKTHRYNTSSQLSALGEFYQSQINLYCQGARLLWPDKTIRGFLLFTHKPQLLELTV